MVETSMHEDGVFGAQRCSVNAQTSSLQTRAHIALAGNSWTSGAAATKIDSLLRLFYTGLQANLTADSRRRAKRCCILGQDEVLLVRCIALGEASAAAAGVGAGHEAVEEELGGLDLGAVELLALLCPRRCPAAPGLAAYSAQ